MPELLSFWCCFNRWCTSVSLPRGALCIALGTALWIPWFAVWAHTIGVWTDWLALAWWARGAAAATVVARATWPALGAAVIARAPWATVRAWAAWWQWLAIWSESRWAWAAWAAGAFSTWAAFAAGSTFAATEFTWGAGELPTYASAGHFAAAWPIIFFFR